MGDQPPIRRYVVVVPDGSGDHNEFIREIAPEEPRPTPPPGPGHPWVVHRWLPLEVAGPQEAGGPGASQIGNEILEPAENPPQDGGDPAGEGDEAQQQEDGGGPAAEGDEAPQEGILGDEPEMEDPEDNQE